MMGWAEGAMGKPVEEAGAGGAEAGATRGREVRGVSVGGGAGMGIV